MQRWHNVQKLIRCFSENHANQITTTPELLENKLATNYVGLTLTTQFVLQSSYAGCSWVARSIGGEISFHNLAKSCFNDSSNSLAEVQCTEDNNGNIATTLHITTALNNQTDEEFLVRCTIANSAPVTIATRTITIAGKNNTITYALYISRSYYSWIFCVMSR